MSEPRLISSYLEVLAAQLPASIVEELAGGLVDAPGSRTSGQSPTNRHRAAIIWSNAGRDDVDPVSEERECAINRVSGRGGRSMPPLWCT